MCTENSKMIPAKDDVAPYVPWAPLFLKGKGFFKKASIAPGSALGDGPSHTHHLRPKLLSVFPLTRYLSLKCQSSVGRTKPTRPHIHLNQLMALVSRKIACCCNRTYSRVYLDPGSGVQPEEYAVNRRCMCVCLAAEAVVHERSSIPKTA